MYPTLVEEATPNSQPNTLIRRCILFISRLRAIFGRFLLGLISGVESPGFIRHNYFQLN